MDHTCVYQSIKEKHTVEGKRDQRGGKDKIPGKYCSKKILFWRPVYIVNHMIQRN